MNIGNLHPQIASVPEYNGDFKTQNAAVPECNGELHVRYGAAQVTSAT